MRGKLTILAIVGLALTACAGSQTRARLPVVTLLGQSADRTGFVLNEENRDYIVSQGVPAGYFTAYSAPTYWNGLVAVPTPQGAFYLDRLAEIEAADLIHAKANPVPPPATTTAKKP